LLAIIAPIAIPAPKVISDAAATFGLGAT